MKNKKFKSMYKTVKTRKSKKCKTVKTRKSKKYKNLTKKIGGSKNNTAVDMQPPASNNICELSRSLAEKEEMLERLQELKPDELKPDELKPDELKPDELKPDELNKRIKDLESEIETLNKHIKKINDEDDEVERRLKEHGPQTVKGILGKFVNNVPPLEQKAVGITIMGGASLFLVVAIGGLVTIPILVNQ